MVLGENINNVLGQLNDIEKFSFVDGPGNRFVIFLQGCNFNCQVCHNPYTINDCNDCGICVEPCPEDALFISKNARVELEQSLCSDCEICIQVCPYDSTPLSRTVTVEEMITRIIPVAPFISGVTVSGGEATMQAEFLYALFKAIKSEPKLAHLTTFIDSNGSASLETWQKLLEVTDSTMIDLKAINSELHFELTQADNTQVLKSIRYLWEQDKLYEIRLLIIPDKNDDVRDLQVTAKWIKSLDSNIRIKIIAYRQNGVREEFLFAEPDKAKMDWVADIFRTEGLARLELIY